MFFLKKAFGRNIEIELIYHMSLSNSYTMGGPPVHGDNPRALASGLSYVQVDKHGKYVIPPTSV